MTEELIQALIQAIQTENLPYLEELAKDKDQSWMTTPLNRRGQFGIHIAAEHNKLEIIKFLLNQNPDLLNVFAKNKATPLIWASSKGCIAVVEYLVELGADLNLAYEDEHGRKFTPLQCALINCHREVIFCLCLKLLKSENHGGATFYLLSGCRPDESKITLYQRALSERRPSFVLTVDGETESCALYQPEKLLGKGSNGEVRLFSDNNSNQKIAVKSEKVVGDYCQSMEHVHREAEFNRKVYPSDPALSFEYQNRDQEMIVSQSRLVMPYLEAEDATIFISKIKSVYQVAELAYAIAAELNRIHSLGIVHGDIKADNIKLFYKDGQLYARFIDFGSSGYDYESKERGPYSFDLFFQAPELRKKKSLKSDVNQDIYSYGYMIQSVIYAFKRGNEVIDLCPSISAFIFLALHPIANRRPSLKEFCEKLRAELNHAFSAQKRENPNSSTETEEVFKRFRVGP